MRPFIIGFPIFEYGDDRPTRMFVDTEGNFAYAELSHFYASDIDERKKKNRAPSARKAL